MRLRLAPLFAFLTLSFTGVHAVPQPVTAPPSTIAITFKQMGVAVDADFKKFTASIDYDPKQPAAAAVQFDIDVASFDLGSPDYNKEVLKPEWFDAARYPKASFKSTAIRLLSAGQLEATGTLTIKGKTRNVKFPVTVKDAGKTRSYDATVRIQRTQFGVGTGEWQATDMVADEVLIKVHAVTPLTP